MQMKKITIFFSRCERFLKCEIRAQKGTPNGTCCGKIFDPEPIIYTEGVCFISTRIMLSSGYFMPFAWIKIHASLDLDTSYGFDCFLFSVVIISQKMY